MIDLDKRKILENMFSEKNIIDLDLSARLQILIDLDVPFATTSAFGYSGVILLYHLFQLRSKAPVYFIDTGFHFPETLALVERLANCWGLNLIRLTFDMEDLPIKEGLGEKPYATDADLCCQIHKVNPLARVLSDFPYWLHALRRDQASTRANIPFIDLSRKDVIKLYPMADWSKEKCWHFIAQNELDVNPLHNENYLSIGCWPCTKRVQEGQHERAGRWSASSKLECGLHHYSGEFDKRET